MRPPVDATGHAAGEPAGEPEGCADHHHRQEWVENLLLARAEVGFEGLDKLAVAAWFVAGDVGEDLQDPFDRW